MSFGNPSKFDSAAWRSGIPTSPEATDAPRAALPLPHAGSDRFTVLLDHQIDIVLMGALFLLQVLALFLTPSPIAWDWAAGVTYMTVGFHLIVLFIQLFRSWPPLFSGKVIGLAGISYWFLLEPFQADGYFQGFDVETVIYGLIQVQIFTLGFLIAYHVIAKKGNRFTSFVAKWTPEPRNTTIFAFVIAFGALLFLTPYFILSDTDFWGTIQKIIRSRSSGKGWSRGNLGGSSSIILALNYFGWAICVMGSVFLMRARGKWILKLFVSGAIFVVLFILFFKGARQSFGLAVLPCVGIAYLGIAPRYRRYANFILLFFIFLLYSAFQLQEVGRGHGFDRLNSARLSRAIHRPAGHQMFIEVLHVSEVMPDVIDYQIPGSTIFFVLINPIPRALWPGKPVSELWIEYAWYRVGSNVLEDESTIAISIIGQFYGEGGIVMVIFAGLFVGFWAFLCDDLMRYHGRRPMILCVSAQLAVLMLLNYRGLQAGLLYTVPAVYILLFINKILEHELFMPSDVGGRWMLERRS